MPTGPLTEFPDSFDGPLPAFGPDGALPPGDFRPPVAEFEARFVAAGDQVQRGAVYAGWNAHRAALSGAGLPTHTRQLVNGSFTTVKPSPADVDIVVEVPIDSDTLATAGTDHPILSLLRGPLMKPEFRCDAYPIYHLPEDDPARTVVTVPAIRYWTKWFGTTRSGSPKGRVWATTGGFHGA